MPSLDTIRTITIKGQTDGVDQATTALNQLTASIAAANDNLAKSNAAANDNSGGFRLTGENAALAANHLRQAAEAAYAFSPAFRGVVNEMAVPALGAASTALAAVAAGIVTATNYAGTGMIGIAGAAEKASPHLLAYTGGVRAAGIAMEGFSPTVGTAASSLLSFLAPALRLVPWLAAAVKGIEMVSEAWRLGNEKLAEYVALSEKAVADGVSTDFYQRITKAATDAKLPVDALTAALNTMTTATADKLGGSTGQQLINELMNSKNFNGATGNFTGNSGVGELSNADTTQQKFQAISDLIDQAMQKGERLAALDVARTFLGSTVADNLARDSDYLNKMLASADKIKSEDLIPQSQIDNAVELQNRLDAAEKILSERWHPIQDLLVQGGIAMKEAWVNIVENIASAVDWATKLISKLGDAPSWFQSMLNRGATAFMDATTTPESRAASETQFGISSNPADMAMLAARQRLSSGLQNPANVSASTDQMNSIQNKVFPDVSKDPNKQAVQDSTAAYDAAENSVTRYIETTKAASLSVSDAASQQEKFKSIATLTAAGIKDGLTPAAAKLQAEMSGLGEKAGAAADALAKAKVASQVDFGNKTSFLSQSDIQIAQQLKHIYGNDVPAALDSTYAASIRLGLGFQQMSSGIDMNLTGGLTDIVTGTKSVSQAFSTMSDGIVRAIEQMIIKLTIVQPLMAAMQSGANSLGIGSINISSLGAMGITYGAPGTSGSNLFGPVAPTFHTGGIIGSEPTSMRYVHPAYFDNAPKFHTGGIAGDEIPIIAKKGEGVFTPGQMAAMGAGGNSAPNIIINNHTDAQPQVSTGSNGDVTITLKKMIDNSVGTSLSSGTGMRVLNSQYGVKQFAGR